MYACPKFYVTKLWFVLAILSPSLLRQQWITLHPSDINSCLFYSVFFKEWIIETDVIESMAHTKLNIYITGSVIKHTIKEASICPDLVASTRRSRFKVAPTSTYYAIKTHLQYWISNVTDDSRTLHRLHYTWFTFLHSFIS